MIWEQQVEETDGPGTAGDVLDLHILTSPLVSSTWEYVGV